MCLAQVLDVLLPAGANGSISTLPIGWPHCPWHAEEFHLAADNLLEVAKFLDHLAQASGREIVLAIEPEPGCILNTAPGACRVLPALFVQWPRCQIGAGAI